MAALFAKFVEDLKKGRDEAYAARGFRQGVKPAPEAAADEPQAGGTGEDADTTSLVSRLTAMVKALRDERDEANRLLADVTAAAEALRQQAKDLEGEVTQHKNQTNTLRAEITTKTRLIEKVSTTVTALKARTGELEGERDQLAEVLLFPGVRKVLLKVTHPDTHPDADQDQRDAFVAMSQKVTSVYQSIGTKKASS